MFKKTKKLDYGIKIFYDVLSKKERTKCFNQFKHLVKEIEGHPGLQTTSNLHEICDNSEYLFNPFPKIKKRIKIDKPIIKSWVNYTDEKLKYTSWHHHFHTVYHENVCVYMLENPEQIGTWFLIENKIYKVKAPTNSLLMFPSDLIHTVPPEIKKPRYTIAIDFY